MLQRSDQKNTQSNSFVNKAVDEFAENIEHNKCSKFIKNLFFVFFVGFLGTVFFLLGILLITNQTAINLKKIHIQALIACFLVLSVLHFFVFLLLIIYFSFCRFCFATVFVQKPKNQVFEKQELVVATPVERFDDV